MDRSASATEWSLRTETTSRDMTSRTCGVTSLRKTGGSTLNRSSTNWMRAFRLPARAANTSSQPSACLRRA